MSMKRKRVKEGDCIDFNGLKISPGFFDTLTEDPKLTVGFDPDVPYEADHPWVFDAEGPIDTLHALVWDFYKSSSRPRKKGEVIHHIDGDVMNATVENLGIGTPAAHGRAHAGKRQKFFPRKRWRLFGFFRPRAEEPIRELDGKELDGYKAAIQARMGREIEQAQQRLRWLEVVKRSRADAGASPSSSASTIAQPPSYPDSSAEWVLSRELPALRAELDHRDSGQKIPPPKGRPRRSDRRHGIGRIRRGCTPGEAALVRLLVKHAFDIEKTSLDTGLSARVLTKMKREPAVDLAIRNWHEWRRLPPPCSARKLKPYERAKANGRR